MSNLHIVDKSFHTLTFSGWRTLWLGHCKNSYWWDWWQEHSEQKLSKLNASEASRHILAHECKSPWHGIDTFEANTRCNRIASVLTWLVSLVETSTLDSRLLPIVIPDFAADIGFTAHFCRGHHFGQRLFLQGAPEIFVNSTLQAVRQGRFHLGVPFYLMRTFLEGIQLHDFHRVGGLFSALRVVSQIHHLRALWRQGLTLDTCIREDYTRFECRVAQLELRHIDSVLLENFYRYRDPGFQSELIESLRDSCPHRFAPTWTLLAEADRLRNLGADYSHTLERGLDHLRNLAFDKKTELFVEFNIPDGSGPSHLMWHFLDKLSLKLQVDMLVVHPLSEAVGNVSSAVFPIVSMSVLPDHDIVSAHIRRDGVFHCPRLFQRLVIEAATRTKVVRIVEVGGFLGDCVLWAAAWLGPARLQALEIEPVTAATARLSESLRRGGFTDAVTIVNEPVGNGQEHYVFPPSVASPNPNFRFCSSSDAFANSCIPQRFRTLDEVLKQWFLDVGVGPIDLVRMKTPGFDSLIVEGLTQHLEAKLINVLLAHSFDAPPTLQKMPWYRNRLPGRQDWVKLYSLN